MYRLRSRVTIENASVQFKVIAMWGDKAPAGAFADPRTAQMGWRALVSPDRQTTFEPGDYTYWRLQNGVPDTGDFIRERSMMLESNMDLLHGVSFDKGCYMGQELTARTHYRALVKKRLLPLRFARTVQIPFDTPVMMGEQTIGYVRSQHRDLGLALLQLENLSDGASVTVGDEAATVFFPEWFILP